MAIQKEYILWYNIKNLKLLKRKILYNYLKKEYNKGCKKGRKKNTHYINLTLKTMVDEKQKAKLMADCQCGSGKMYGACCGTMEDCFCGSGKPAGQCCMANPKGHGVDMDKEKM